MVSNNRPEQIEKLARVCHGDAPGTVLDRWRAACLGALVGTILASGRDVTVMIGRRIDRKAGDLHVVLSEERN